MFPIMAGNSASTGYNLTRSLRFRASAYLNRTPASASNRTTWTWSAWVKLGAITTGAIGLYTGYLDDNNRTTFYYQSNQLIAQNIIGGGADSNLTTSGVWRDPSAWYHVMWVYDSTNATAANRSRTYINGVLQTVTGPNPSSSATSFINYTCPQNIGRINYSTPQAYLDGYLTEVNLIDGQALTPSSFGSTNATTGVWQPARYTGTYGTNGFYLPFTDNSALTTSSNVGLGKDFSGNGNYWATNNISITSGVTYDSMTDVPTLTSATAANYCVLNTLDGTNMSYITASNANLTYSESASASGWRAIRGTIGVTTGKYRFSVYGTIGASNRMSLGLCTSATDLGGYFNSSSIGLQYSPYDGAYYLNDNGSGTAYGSTQRITAVFDFIFDAATGKCWVAVNGTLLGGNPDAGTGEMATFTTTSPVFPVTQAYGSSWDVNFGQRPWDYTIATASSFVALNTYNLP